MAEKQISSYANAVHFYYLLVLIKLHHS